MTNKATKAPAPMSIGVRGNECEGGGDWGEGGGDGAEGGAGGELISEIWL